MNNKYNTILFDLDGTLTDPKQGITNSIIYALKKFEINEKNKDKLEKFIGPPLINSFETYYNFNKKKAVKAVKYYREYYAKKGIFENVVYEGITELLAELTGCGKKLYVATSKPTVYARKVISYFSLDKFFEEVVGSNLDGTRTDKGEIIQFALDKYILEKNNLINNNEILMIGDRYYDICGAQENGIDAAGVTYGYGSQNELSKYSPDYLIDSVDDLKNIIID